MARKRLVIASSDGDTISVPMQSEGPRQVGSVLVDDVKYHVERIRAAEYFSKYKVDADPEYEPQTDQNGYCVIFAPFSKRLDHGAVKSKVRR
ncbi:MAG: hypothetical protein KGL31_05445 [candidate division NC10 bacterium]|nr:hypothetical protein [candidate division NC10 bacterium]MDE2321348.1 hypothetical protein [candidate division NC10 bacterium]